MRFDELRFGQTREGEDDRTRSADSANVRAWLHYGLATFAFALALLAKPSAVVVPVVVAVLVLGLRRRRIACFGRLDRGFSWPPGWRWSHDSFGANDRRAYWKAFRSLLMRLAFYISKLLVPWHLIPDYGRTPGWLFSHSVVHYTFILPLALAIVCVVLWRKARWVAVGAGIFAIALLPVLGLAPFSYQKFSTVADRYAYLAMLSPALMVAFLASRWSGKPIMVVMAC